MTLPVSRELGADACFFGGAHGLGIRLDGATGGEFAHREGAPANANRSSAVPDFAALPVAAGQIRSPHSDHFCRSCAASADTLAAAHLQQPRRLAHTTPLVQCTLVCARP